MTGEHIHRRFSASNLVKKYKGLNKVYACPFCKFVVTYPCGTGFGRGHGLRIGSLGVGQIVKHMHEEHPEEIARLKADHEKRRAASLKE